MPPEGLGQPLAQTAKITVASLPLPTTTLDPGARHTYGEVSEEVHALESAFAVAIATREWRSMGARTESEARGLITTQLRRELSVATHAGHARMLLSRRAYVGLSHEGARALGDRRAGDHQGIAVFIPPTTEGARRRAQRARAHGGGSG